LVQIQSLMRAVINFYNFNNRNAPVVITRVKEHDSERMCMDRLERAIFDSCDEDCKATPSRYAIWGEDSWLIDIGYKAYHVVDGQQRLTTFSILIYEIISFIKKLDENQEKHDGHIFIGFESSKLLQWIGYTK
jgi:hypothetical protein